MCYLITTMPVVFTNTLGWFVDKNNWGHPLVVGVVGVIVIIVASLLKWALKKTIHCIIVVRVWNYLLNKLKVHFSMEKNRPLFWWLIININSTLLTLIVTCVYDVIKKQSLFTTFTKIMDTDIKLWVVVALVLLLWLVIISRFKLVSQRREDIFIKDYLPKINELSTMLQLDKWDDFAGWATRLKVQSSFLEINDKVKNYKYKMIKTGCNKKIEDDILFIIDTFNFFINIILEHTEEKEGWLLPVRFYRGSRSDEAREKFLKLYKEWECNCNKAFYNYVYALNSLIKDITPFSDYLTEDYLRENFTVDGSIGKLSVDVLPENYEKNRIVEYAPADDFE
jgi:hypothetical protein